MITDGPLLIKKLKRWQCYRQIIDCYQQYKCVSCLARQFRMSTDEANIIAGIKSPKGRGVIIGGVGRREIGRVNANLNSVDGLLKNSWDRFKLIKGEMK